MRRLEVRCCCEPSRLLGTLPVMDSHVQRHQITFPVMKPRRAFDPAAVAPLNHRPPNITLEVRDLFMLCTPLTRAIKADGVSIETLRLIPGFIEEK